MITIIVNDRALEIAKETATVADLVEVLDLASRRFFIIEKNGDVITKAHYATESVNHNDSFEIVHFVGGG
ncbi:sulfur carrier protein ThiS [Ignatzschineria sp. RMDPL8A]|uniref:sulfur carrier protein ThiS n=1 Tax=Ignatzschineria sp. RMDPL8A TaxID=2999236 RepID=UPI0016AC1F94|nr:sulfur carrier protein ThiS [Ignatzschineria sp. RMDPL8A]MDG9729432.1 sulfur carrier protein ThiS [Ignatzschineria sp. RMDPL8A]NLD09158.1 sulfur carrier protein ThiS [Xanthomonadaceae bacterium]